MGKQLLLIEVRGRQKEWGFEFMGDPEHMKDWEEDGLQVFFIENTIPEWVVDLGLKRPWCFFQDLFHFKNPFR